MLPQVSIYIKFKREILKPWAFFVPPVFWIIRNDVIKKHEDTIHKREILFANYLKTVGFNAEPVLITYPQNDTLFKAIIQKETQKVPEYDFTTPDKKRHQLWCINDSDTVAHLQSAFEGMEKIYIADGHHRSASSNLLSRDLEDENESHTGNEPYNYFLSYLIPESEIRIYEFNQNGQRPEWTYPKRNSLIQLDACSTELKNKKIWTL